MRMTFSQRAAAAINDACAEQIRRDLRELVLEHHRRCYRPNGRLHIRHAYGC